MTVYTYICIYWPQHIHIQLYIFARCPPTQPWLSLGERGSVVLHSPTLGFFSVALSILRFYPTQPWLSVVGRCYRQCAFCRVAVVFTFFSRGFPTSGLGFPFAFLFTGFCEHWLVYEFILANYFLQVLRSTTFGR